MAGKMILGIYHPAEGQGHDSALALLDSRGRLLAAHSEERFSRIKMDGGYPFRALDALRKMFPFKAADLEAVALPYWESTAKLQELGRVALHSAVRPGFAPGWLASRSAAEPFQKEFRALGAYEYTQDYRQQILKVQRQDRRPQLKNWPDFLKYAGLENAPLIRVDHHVAHAASAYFAAGWDEALILTADGAGALKSGLTAVGRGGKIHVLARTFLPNSPGRFWEIITHLCGFNHHKHGGKVTGLAASGNPNAACYEIMKKALWADGLTVGSHLRPAELSRQLAGVPREDLAAAAQRRLEEVLCSVAAEAVRRTGLKRIVLAGGVFSNVLLNQKIYELPGVEDIFIFPAMGDEGLPAGAALWALSQRKWLEPYPIEHVFLGPEYSEKEMEQALLQAGLKYERMESEPMVKRIADLLTANKVVAYYEGRMEYGPRALGHRSILYPTVDRTVNDWLNQRLRRSEFMPFAPVTLAEEAANCYLNIKPNQHAARFMTLTYQCTEKMKKTSPAVVHLDGTARPQLVTREINGRYYDVVKEYFRRTGIPSLVNTSFNMHEEPIVCTPEDAVRGFLDGGLDALILGPFCVHEEAGHV